MDEMTAFCENADCRVVMFRLQPNMEQTSGRASTLRNCPGCGRMGRLKDK